MIKKSFILLLMVFAIPQCIYAQVGESRTDIPVFGWLEKVKIIPSKVMINAEMHITRRSSTFYVDEFKIIKPKKDAEDQSVIVKYTITDRTGQVLRLEQPILRMAKIKRRDGKKEERPVIEMGLCLGATYLEGQFYVVKKNSPSEMLSLGRYFLSGHAIVNPALSYTAEPLCKIPKKEKTVEPEADVDNAKQEDKVENNK